MKRTAFVGLAMVVFVAANVRCGPARRSRIEQLVQEFTGQVPMNVRTSEQLKAAYTDVLEDLLPGMKAEQLVDREQPQQTFEAICVRAARPGAQDERTALCEVIAEYLDPDDAKPVRVWLLRQLERISGEESVGKLGELLDDPDPRIRELARRSLQNNPAPAAGDTLRTALTRAKADDPTWRVALINALAARGDPADAYELALGLLASDQRVVVASAAALGDVGGARAADALDAMWRGDDERLRDTAAAALIRIADRLAEAGQRDRAAAIYRDMYHSSIGHSNRVAALRGLAAAEGEKALPRLLPVIRGEVDPNMQRLAVDFAARIPDPVVTQTLIREMSDASPALQVLLIKALAWRGDALAKTVLIDALDSDEADVRIAAACGLRHLGDESDVIPLARFAANAGGDERDAARHSLWRLPGVGVDQTILAGVRQQQEPNVRAELIRSLARRRVASAVQTLVWAAMDQSGTVRAAAFESLGELANETDLPALLDLLVNETQNEAREAAQDAVVAICLRLDDENRRAEPVLAVFSGTNPTVKASLIRVLGRLQGPRALSSIRAAVGDHEAEVQDAAVRALAKWDDPIVLDDLLQIARTGAKQNHQVLALRGYVRLVRLPSDREPLETLDMLDGAMQLAQRPQEKKLVLSAVADVIHLDALAVAAGCLDDEALRNEAAASVVNIAGPLSAAHYQQAVAAVESVLALQISDGVRAQADQTLESIERHAGYITAWMVSGPYMEEGLKAADLLDTPFGPEQQDASGMVWRELPVTNPKDPWTFNLSKAIGGSNRCVYVKTMVWSETDQPAQLEIGSDDGVKVWVSGEVVHANNVIRGHALAQDKVDIRLHAGWNALMLKITQGGGDWAVSCGLKSPDGGNLDGLRFKAE